MKEEIVIEARNLRKYYKIYADRSHELKDLLVNFGRARYEKHEVLKGISFQVRRGEVVAFIGKNGCGKSTTLKLLTRIIRPSEGEVIIKGRVSSLIELGAGFHPDMTGRENIYINASLFGFTAKEIDQKIGDIIRFSELEDYIDVPVRTYSSGMYMRLAFSVAINVDPEILLVDEILGVGDAAFQVKCFNKVKELKNRGTTIVIVSHSLGQVEQLCDRAIWIEDGLIKEEGTPRVVCMHYTTAMEQKRLARAELEYQMVHNQKNGYGSLERDLSATCKDVSEQASQDAMRQGTEEIVFTGIHLLDKEGQLISKVKTGKEIKIKASLKSNITANDVVCIISIENKEGIVFYRTRQFIGHLMTSEERKLSLTIYNLALLNGDYYITCSLTGENCVKYDTLNRLIMLKIDNGSDMEDESGIIALRHSWRIGD